MAWCRQATSHYLSQCWPRSMLPYGVTRPQWVKVWSFRATPDGTKPLPGVGVTKPIFSVPLFPTFPLLSKQTLAIEYHVYIWQVSPQLSCGDTCQIWMWFRESNRYFCKIENFAYREISERSFSNPHPRTNVALSSKCFAAFIWGQFHKMCSWT